MLTKNFDIMKRLFSIFTIMILLSFVVKAQDNKFIKLNADVECGYFKGYHVLTDSRVNPTKQSLNGGAVIDRNNIDCAYGNLYSDITIKLTIYKHFHLDFGMLNIFNKKNMENITFSPSSVEYITKAYIPFKNNIILGYEHSCTHPVINESTSVNFTRYRASYNKIYIKYSF